MTHLELNVEEQEILADALESFISDLRMEICDTEQMDFRLNLKNQERILQRVLGHLRPAGHAAA
ncbi:MAG: hypothetical protein HYU77_01310 [Betaproteobacteria bacterium]|nr:hypothetical protein [Betaproteobacteria bacterium]